MKSATTKHTEPLRLLRRGGTWSLEYTRLVSVDEHLLRPERRQVAASADVLRSLPESCPAARVEEAVALMHQRDDGSERAFELMDDGWTQVATHAASQPPLTHQELVHALSDTKAQLALLRGLYDALRQRVLSLESSNAALRRSLPPTLGRRVPSRKSVLDSLRNPPRALESARPAVQATPPAIVGRSSTAEAVPRPVASSPPETKVDETLASPGATALTLPSAPDVVGCLQMLAADVAVTQHRSDVPSDLGDFLSALLTDEAGEAVAALLFNQRAGAEFGGGILGATPADRDAEAKNGLSSDSLDGLNEVANNLCGLVNRANPKRPVRLGTLARDASELPPWLKKPAKKLGFSLRDGGNLLLLAR